jgi:hypothetical protein
MADTFTTNYNFRKCEVGADNNTWGGFTNSNWDLLDTTLFSNLALKLSLSGGTMTGTLQSLDVIPADNTNRKLGSSAKVFSDAFVQNINFYTPAGPTLNGTLFSSGTGWVLKFSGAGQSFVAQDHSGNTIWTSGESGAFSVGRVSSPGSANLTVYGAGVFSNTVTGQNFVATSDARLKKDVREIDDALSLALSLRGVRFKWIDDGLKEDGEDQFGVLAQEVQQTAPGAVRVNAGKYLGVDYNQLVPILIEGIRVLTERVCALENRNEP